MGSSAPSPATVLEAVDDLAPPGTPLTTPEVADEFDCTARTIYNKLDSLVDDGVLETKKVGSRGRVWWRPPRARDSAASEPIARHASLAWSEDADENRDALEHQAHFLEAILSNVDDHVHVWNREKEYVYGNERLEELYEMSRDEYLGKTNRELGLPPELCDRFEREIERVFESGASTSGEISCTDSSGVNAYYDYIFSPIRGQDGSVEFVAGISRDTTERRRAEAEATESTFRQLFEKAPGLYLVVAPEDYEIVAVSDAYLEATMTEREDIMGKTLFEVFPPDPDDPDSEGVSRLRESLARVEAERQADMMPVTYYPIPRPESEGGGFEDRWWSPVNSPVFSATNEIDYIIHRVEDVTSVVQRFKEDGRDDVLRNLDAGDSHLTTDVILRGQELHRMKERAYERLRESEERYRTLFESIDEGFCVIERIDADSGKPTDFRYVKVNPAFEEHSGVADVVGKTLQEVFPRESAEWVETYETVLRTGEPIRLERELPTQGRILELYAFQVGDGSREQVGVIFQDITERKRTQNAIERLNDVSQELMEADTQEIHDRTADIAQDVLGVEYAALWQYDETTGELEQGTTRIDPDADRESIRLPDRLTDQIWQTFISHEIAVENDLPTSESTPSESQLRSSVLVPLGRHGVICLASTHSAVFDETRVDIAGTMVATIETALDRAEGERRLERQNEELTRLDRLNSLIRDIDQALVQADTLEAIDLAVCERLADSDQFEFAWIGEYDAVTDTIEPREWAGIDGSYVDGLSVTTSGSSNSEDPVVAAFRTQETHVVADIATDLRAGSWREATLERGARSCISIPLVYEQSLHGVVTVYGRTPQPDERDHDVLAELGSTIAHAINAVETRETLQADSVVELTVRFQQVDTPLCRFARQAGCTIEFEGFVPQSEGDVAAIFFTATGVSPDELSTAGEQSIAIEELTFLSEHQEGTLVKARLSDPTLASQFLEQDAVVRSLTIEEDVATAVVELHQTAEVREFIERLRETVADLDLLARHTRSRPLETQHTFRMAYEDRLTPRQKEVLHTAYQSGFFESPRVRTGSELSDALGISQSTFTHHLREAERKLCELTFEHP
ncbi:PAS sensor protein [Natronococcus pandeyae]|uniref:PAS sensor protein n=1 Tax=Natronococcus pandeyae TaxID=2055836 RepID=A0A8J8Q4S7_9EURY|nr:bacterio-opsin activator domain-containing protein [Natronococcus pandeyae]TYL38428.1 PAS sensor protein [Natronococcus pandeyae]